MNRPTQKAVLAAARANVKPVASKTDPAVARMNELLAREAGFLYAIAKQAGVGRNDLRRYMRGERMPRVDTLRAILNALQHDIVVIRRRET